MSAFVFGQSADVITELLDAQQATYGEVCYLSAVQQNFVDEKATYEEAIYVLRTEGQIDDLIDANSPITAKDTAYIFAKMWDIDGGLMYRLSGGSPRYAFKQFQADGVVASTVDPSQILSGSAVLRMYTASLKKYGDFNMKNVSMEAE